MSLPLPRPVGVASDAERLVIDLVEKVPPAELADRLNRQMPVGIAIHRTRQLEPGDRCLPTHVQYRVQLLPPERVDIEERVERLLMSDSAVVTRKSGTKSPAKSVDIRPFTDWIRVEKDALILGLHVTTHGTARPAEICEAVGLKDPAILHRVRRIEVTWRSTPP
jgi:radical SAM-linked protein